MENLGNTSVYLYKIYTHLNLKLYLEMLASMGCLHFNGALYPILVYVRFFYASWVDVFLCPPPATHCPSSGKVGRVETLSEKENFL